MCDACGKRTTLLAEDAEYHIVCNECKEVAEEADAD